MMTIDTLPAEVIEEGRGHPFVMALVEDLRREQRQLEVSLRDAMATPNGNHVDRCHVLAGRAQQVRDVLIRIQRADGQREE